MMALLLVAAMLAAMVLSGCDQEAEIIDLNMKSLYLMKKGEILQLDNPSESIRWSSSDASVATVSDSGLVTAVAVGTATVTADVNGALYNTQIRVEEAEEVEIYNGFTASELDAIPGVGYSAFVNAMDATWNFGWEGNGTLEYNATKVDFNGTAASDAVIWRLGTLAAEDAAATINAGWGVQMWTKGEGNIAYMYNKVRIPPSTTEFRVWAVGNTDQHLSGAGSVRTVAIYRENGGDYVVQVLKPLESSFTGSKTTTLQENGSVKFTNANWNMPDTVDGCMLTYDISQLPIGQDVIIMIEGIGLGEILGDEYTEAAEGVPAGQVMPDMVIVKRVMFVANAVPVEEGTELSVPTNNAEQELLYKVADGEGLYLNFLPPTNDVYDKDPVLFLICGGGWVNQSRASILSMMATMVSGLRAEGFAVVCPDYRVITENNDLTVCEEIVDLMDAGRYIAHYADVLGIDAQKIVTSGHSAGGHLALMLAWADHDLFKGDGFTDEFGVFCSAPLAGPTVMYGTSFTYYDRAYLCGGEEAAKLCSPCEYITADTVPTLLMHGDKDNNVHIDHANSCIEKAQEVGAPIELLLSVNGNHVLGCDIRGEVASPNLNSALTQAVEWICSQLDK